MLPERYLIAGLDALVRSHPTPEAEPGFGNGHRAASMISAYFLFKDGLTEAEAEAPIRALADHWLAWPIFAPMPQEPAAPGELERLLSALSRSCGGDAAHGVIFPSLALRAFSERPDLITRSRIDGLMHIAEAYTLKEPLAEPLPARPFPVGAFADQVLAGFVASTVAYRGVFQGGPFHVLTFGQAVQDLQALGHVDLARRAEVGFRACLANYLLGPKGPNPALAFPVTDPQPQSVRPDQARFWLSLTWGAEFAQGLGHVIKYAYAFNALCRRATDSDGVARAREQYYLSAWG
jgi:hypothetical protein